MQPFSALWLFIFRPSRFYQTNQLAMLPGGMRRWLELGCSRTSGTGRPPERTWACSRPANKTLGPWSTWKKQVNCGTFHKSKFYFVACKMVHSVENFISFCPRQAFKQSLFLSGFYQVSTCVFWLAFGCLRTWNLVETLFLHISALFSCFQPKMAEKTVKGGKN